MDVKGEIKDPILIQLLNRLKQLDEEELEKVQWIFYEKDSDSSSNIRKHPSGDI